MAPNMSLGMYAGRKPAWHLAGIVKHDMESAEEGVRLAGIGYQVTTHPTYYEHPMLDGSVELRKSGLYAIIREPIKGSPEYVVFGHAGEHYTPVQNMEIARMLDASLTKQFPVETVGAIGEGEIVFFTLNIGSANINGDEVNNFFLVTNGHDGKTGLKVAHVPNRVVCQNTLNYALQNGVIRVDLKHTRDVKRLLEAHLTIVPQMRQTAEKAQQAFEAFGKLRLSEDEINQVIVESYPYPSQPRRLRYYAHGVGVSDELQQEAQRMLVAFDLAKFHVDARREEARRHVEMFREENSGFARTGWEVYNAICGNEDHTPSGPTRTGSAAVSAIMGDRAEVKVRAFKNVLDRIGRN